MRSLILFTILISLHLNGCARASEKNVIFIFDEMSTAVYERGQLLKNIQEIDTQLHNDGLNFNFKIIHSHECHIVEISNSAKRTPPVISESPQNYLIEGESTLHNLLKWLRESPSNSVIYMITNVIDPSDKYLVNEILETIQIKGAEVNFILILKSQSLRNLVPEVYRLISFVSNGYYVLQPDFDSSTNGNKYIDNVNKFIESTYTELSFISRKVNILSIDHAGDGIFCFYLDSLMTYLVQHVIMENPTEYKMRYNYKMHAPDFHIFGGFNITVTLQKCFKLKHTVVSSVTLQNPSSYRLRIYITSEFNFNYGFSTDSVSSLNETYIRPVIGKSNQIYVSSNQKNLQVRFNSFNIIFRNGTSSRKYNLFPVDHDPCLFVGYFEPPNEEYFYIQVQATVNGEIIFRTSSNAINAAKGFGKDENNPMLSESSGIDLETIFLIIILLCSIVLLCLIFMLYWYNIKYKQLMETFQYELEKPHLRAKSNIYCPATFTKFNTVKLMLDSPRNSTSKETEITQL